MHTLDNLRDSEILKALTKLEYIYKISHTDQIRKFPQLNDPYSL